MGHQNGEHVRFQPMRRAESNPFRSECVTSLPFHFENGSWNEVLTRLDQLGGRGAVVGPCGSGKTTFLEELAEILQNRGHRISFERLNDQNRVPSRDFNRQKWIPDDALIIDGAEQLSPLQWQTLKWRVRGAGIFVISTHHAGRLPLLLPTSTSPALARKLVEELGENWPPSEIEALYHAHGGNLRLVLMELYDRVSQKWS